MSDWVILLSIAASLVGFVRRGSTIGSIQVADLLEALRALGADPAALCVSVGLTESTLQNPTARVPSSRVLALFERAARQLRDPLVGLHAGARTQTRGPLFYLLLSSPRLSEGLQLLTRFARVALDTQVLTATVDGGVVNLTVDPGDPAIEQNHHAVDYLVGANLSGLRRAVPSFQLLGVDLAHAEAGTPGETERVFGCPVRFGRRHSAMRFPDSTLQSVPVAANSAIAEQIEKFTAAAFARMTSDSAQARVAEATRALLGRGLRVDRSAVAKQLGVGERTLQRQLEQESVTFSVVRDGVRAEISRALLSNHGLKVEAVAHSVGFAEVAAFSRAFTRWVGHSPTRYRDRIAKRSVTPRVRPLNLERGR